LEFENRQRELLDLLGQMTADGLKVVGLTDRDAEGQVIPLAEIGPQIALPLITTFASPALRQ
jgi:hypothetical protein